MDVPHRVVIGEECLQMSSFETYCAIERDFRHHTNLLDMP